MAAHLERASIEDLINQCALAGDHAQIDIIYLEIADRVKQLNDFAKEASTIIVQLLKQDNSVTVFGVVRLLEFLSKNTSPIFHQYLASKNHSEAFLLALRRVRGKKSLKNKLEKKDVQARWAKSDQILLSLVQLWADTFMMHQEKYPGYFSAYKTLCIEKVSFPMRDPNIRMLMESVCKESPMYDHVEEIYHR